MAETGPVLLPAPCWVLADSYGIWDDRHWQGRDLALAELGREGDPDRGREGELHLEQVPCRLATAACGYVFDRDGDGICHLPGNLEEAEELLFDAQWVRLSDGQWACGSEVCRCVELLGEGARPRARAASGGPKWTNDRLDLSP